MKKFNLFKNIAYFSGSVLIFFAGMVVYGVVLNLRQVTLDEAMVERTLLVVVGVVVPIAILDTGVFLVATVEVEIRVTAGASITTSFTAGLPKNCTTKMVDFP